MRARAAVLLGAAALLGARGAAAQASHANSAAAQVAFDEAKQLMAKGNYAEACPKLGESERLDPGPGTEFHLADCYEHLGKTASAWSGFVALADALNVAHDAARAAEAQKRADALVPRLARLAIRVSDPARASGLEVRRDGDVVGQPLWGSAVPVNPGSHAVAATAPGMTSWQETVSVTDPGKTVTVDVPRLEPAAAPAGPAVPAAPSAPTEPPHAGPVSTAPAGPAPSAPPPRWIGYALLGVGVAGTVVGSIFGLQAFSKKSDGDAHCNAATNVCDQTGLDLHADSRTAATVSTIGFGVGVAGVASGVLYLLLTGKSSPRTTALGAAPWIDGRTAGLAATGTF